MPKLFNDMLNEFLKWPDVLISDLYSTLSVIYQKTLGISSHIFSKSFCFIVINLVFMP